MVDPRKSTTPASLGLVDTEGRLRLSTRFTKPTAQAFIREHYTAAGRPLLWHFAGRFYRWIKSVNRYEPVEDAVIAAQMGDFLATAHEANPHRDIGPFPANVRNIQAAVKALELETILPATLVPPFRTDTREPSHLIHGKTCNFDIDSRECSEVDPAIFNLASLDYDPNPAAPEPRQWLQFLHQIWPDDIASQQLLQQWFGYCLTKDISYHKAMLWIGPPRTGKGTASRVLKSVLGHTAVTPSTTSGLSSNFGLSALINRRLCIVGDARFGTNKNGAGDIFAERILAITGGDGVNVDRKYVGNDTVELNTLFLLMTNVPPKFEDISNALVSRFLVLSFSVSFLGREDHQLEQRLQRELPGILNWSIDGLSRLQEIGRFIQPTSGEEIIETLKNLANPITEFVREHCEFKMGGWVTCATLRNSFNLWANQNELRTLDPKNFSLNLKAAFPQIGSPKQGNKESNMQRKYIGITLKPDAPRPDESAL